MRGTRPAQVMDRDALLSRARAARNPEEKRALLLRAEEISPGALALQTEWLLLGDAGRNGESPDPARLKCYLLHAFEHPLSHDEAAQRRMARELFDYPRLTGCLARAADPAAFLREYLRRLSDQYIEIFIQGQRGHVPGLLGYALPRRLPRYWAAPMADVIRNVFLCPFLTGEEQALLAGAFYRACYQRLDGRVGPLDAFLGAELCALLQ